MMIFSRHREARRTVSAFTVGLLAVGLGVFSMACGDDSQPQPTSDPQPATCSEALALSALRVDKGEVDDIDAAHFKDRELCWEPVEGAVKYDVDMTVGWYGNCDVWQDGRPLSLRPVGTQTEVSAPATSFSFSPPDPDYPSAKDMVFMISATSSTGETISTGGFSYQLEIDYPERCGERSSLPMATPQVADETSPYGGYEGEPWPQGVIESGQAPASSMDFRGVNVWQHDTPTEHIQVFAGARGQDPSQGVLWILIHDYLTLDVVPNGGWYDSPVREGTLRITDARDDRVLTVVTEAGTELTFDMTTRTFE